MRQEEIDEFLLIKTPEGRTVRELSVKEFCKFFLSKLSNIPAYNKEVQYLTRLLNFWNQTTMSEETRVDVVQRIRNLGLI